MKKLFFITTLILFFISCLFVVKLPVILTYGMITTTIDLIFKTELLRNCIYTEIFLLSFLLSSYITYKLRGFFYKFIFK